MQDLGLQRRRLALISTAFLFLATFLGFRLLQKQVFEHSSYSALAKSQQYESQSIQGKRGQILAKDGQGNATYPLATNQTTYALNLVPSQIADKRGTAEKVAPLAQLGNDFVYEQINNSKLYIPPVKHKLTYEEAQSIKDLKLPGVFISPEESRFYPEDAVGANVLGFVNPDGDGQYGIEQYYNSLLKGTDGEQYGTRDASGKSLGAAAYVPPQDGSNIILTIDRNVQFQAEQALAEAVKKFSASGGSLIVMNPKTGAIIAMASQPTFDPNRYASYDIGSYTNQAVSGTYEPGSTFKPIAMASGLDAGAVTPATSFFGTASIKVDDREIFNSQKKGYGNETMTEVIQRSDNVGMVWMQQRLGNQKFYDYIKRFGFGTQTGIELAGEATADLKPIDDLYPVNFATMSFGQGISVTPIQLITAIGSFANNGQLVQPHIVEQIQRKNGKVETVETKAIGQTVSPKSASEITGMMVRVVEAGAGKPAAVPGYRVAGKTGTAQIATGGAYEANTTIGNFVGFAPVEDPRFVMLVKVDRPKGVTFAEESAAPTFGVMAKFLLNYYNVPPSS